ncbi:hypothetical protein SAV14893_084930 [Streptomyces avermitilis]|uniref:Uncharacterized protein n=1 Tax=Streptomyces avermitilis TaxID=33903 RepID=A0A4D4MAZ4_STRAX|nr:hypothetical protein SAV14893_084930 [Streptomyces avermitilis]GDY70518.1 hypothetical protein SAV31267_000030 [Streptomyces avermitilis]
MLALLRGFDVLADAFSVGEPCGDAGGAGDRGVSDLFALLFQGGERGQGSLAFVEAGAVAGLGEGVRVAAGVHAGPVLETTVSGRRVWVLPARALRRMVLASSIS